MLSETDTLALVYHTIADRIEAACRALNLKQRQLAERAGLPSRQLLTQIKSGERPGRKHLEALALQMGCTVEWLTTGTGMAPSWAGPVAAPVTRVREAAVAYDDSALTACVNAIRSDFNKLLDIIERQRGRIAELERQEPPPLPAVVATLRAALEPHETTERSTDPSAPAVAGAARRDL